MKIILDVDDTICFTDKSIPYSERKPKPAVISAIRWYKKQGFEIVFCTGRQMRTYKGNVGKIAANTLPVLIEWLNKYGVPYDEIYIGKPWQEEGGFCVDDSTVTPEEFVTLTYEQIQEKLAKGRGKK